MGGWGSTRWGGELTRETTDPYLWLDVRLLARRGALIPGTWATTAWTHRGEPSGLINHTAEADALILDYRTRRPGEADWRPVRERVPLTRTACHYGGGRPWFICLSCGRRRAVLYSVGGYFRCRSCHGLAYSSTREPASDRAMRRADKLRARIGAKPGMHQLADKPRGMHWTTYSRIVSEINACDHDALALFVMAREKLIDDLARYG